MLTDAEIKVFEKVGSIVLNMEPVFVYLVEIRDKQNRILDKIKMKPDKAEEEFYKINNKWVKYLKLREKEDGIISTSERSS